MSDDLKRENKTTEIVESSNPTEVCKSPDMIIANQENQKTFDKALLQNQNKIEGSVGEYLTALRPGMALIEAEAEQQKLNQSRIESFGIVDDSGEVITARKSSNKIIPRELGSVGEKQLIFDYQVSPSFAQQVCKNLEAIPRSHRNLLANNGFRLEIHKDIRAYDAKHGTTYATDHPTGYDPGCTGENVDVFFDQNNKVVVALEYFKPYGFSKQVPSSILNNPGRLHHEIGHAFSMARNYDIEKDPATMSLFENLRQKLNTAPITQKALFYFSQAPGRDTRGKIVEHYGLRETIAEFYASYHSSGADPRKHVEKSLFELYKPIWEIMKTKGYFN